MAQLCHNSLHRIPAGIAGPTPTIGDLMSQERRGIAQLKARLGRVVDQQNAAPASNAGNDSDTARTQPMIAVPTRAVTAEERLRRMVHNGSQEFELTINPDLSDEKMARLADYLLRLHEERGVDLPTN